MAKLTGYNIAVALVVALGGFSYGFIAGAFATCIGQPGFYIYFKLDRMFHTTIQQQLSDANYHHQLPALMPRG